MAKRRQWEVLPVAALAVALTTGMANMPKAAEEMEVASLSARSISFVGSVTAPPPSKSAPSTPPATDPPNTHSSKNRTQV